MRPEQGNTFAVSPGVFDVMVFASILIFGFSVYYKGAQYISESRFAEKDTIPLPRGLTVKMVYPSVLKVVPSENRFQQLSVDIANYTPNSNLQVVLDFSKSKGIIFHDSDGNVISSILTIDLPSSVNGVGIYVRPEPLLDQTDTTAYLNVKITSYLDGKMDFSVTKKYKIELKYANKDIGKYWLDPLIDNGILISLALALMGWGLDFRKRQKEETSKERQSMLESLRETSKTDAEEAMQRLVVYEKENWTEPFLSDSLKTLRKQFESKEYLGELLYLAGEALARGDYAEAEENLRATREYISKKDNPDKVLSCIKEKPDIPDDKDDVLALLSSTLLMWEKYDEYSRKIVVHVIYHICKKHEKNTEAMDSVRKTFEEITGEPTNRLLRDPEIKLYADKWFSPEKYHWVESALSAMFPEHHGISKWLSISGNRLNANPFKISTNAYLYSVSFPPENWEEIKEQASMLLISESNYDRELLARYSEKVFQKNEEDENVFPVYLQLAVLDTAVQLPTKVILKEIIDAVAFVWIKLIGRNPSAFLNLSRFHQYEVAEFLTWMAGSTLALQLRLRQHGLRDTLAGNMILRRIRELPEKVAPDTITNEKMFGWIALKPPNLKQTYLLIDLQPVKDQKLNKQVLEQLLTLSYPLSRTNTIFKIFTAPAQSLSLAITQLRIRWNENKLGNEEKVLEKILNTCVSKASPINDLKFNELFWPQPSSKAVSILAEKANGSLGELLRLGNAVINNHVRKSPQDPHLDESDLEGI